MKKGILTVALASLLAVGCFAACDSKGSAELSYSDGITQDGSYDTDLFYRNDFQVNHAADPGCTWVSKEENEEWGGYFYLYSTSLYYNIEVMRSKDLNIWEDVGHALDFDGDQWFGTSNSANIWAPEVIYDPQTEMYFMYSSAAISGGGNQKTEMFIAVSDNPGGGFRLIGDDAAETYGEEYRRDAYGTAYTAAGGSNFSFRMDHGTDWIWKQFKTGIDVTGAEFQGLWAIDPSPFIDDNGDWYVYFRCNREALKDDTGSSEANSYDGITRLAVVKMKNPWTPDYSSLKFVAYPNYQSTEDAAAGKSFPLESSTCNEAPFMIKHNGIYYLTYAFGGYTQRAKYCVSMAVSESPMGPFVKMAAEDGNPSLYIEGYMDQMSGPGHHAFVPVGDEIFVIYHSMMDRANGSSNPRAIAVDRVEFISGKTFDVKASDYGINTASGTFDVIYSNGPSWSLQPLPVISSGYSNVAKRAAVTATNGDSTTIKYLNDGLYAAHSNSAFMEFEAYGKTTITLTWAKPVTIRAIMIYNSFDYFYAFSQIDRIDFMLAEQPATWTGGNLESVYINNLAFHSNYWNHDEFFMRPGGSCHASFSEITVTSIEITISKKLDKDKDEGNNIKVSDIVVLGKED